MKKNTYVVIQSFMVDELALKGNELIVFAVIYGYTQDGDHWYYGTRGHLAEWCGASKGTVSNCLNSLLKKGLLEKREVQRPGAVENWYRATVEKSTPLPKIDVGGTKNCDTPLSKIDRYNNKGYIKNNKGVVNKKNPGFPQEIDCKCGGSLVITPCRKPGTDLPIYRCEQCGGEQAWG